MTRGVLVLKAKLFCVAALLFWTAAFTSPRLILATAVLVAAVPALAAPVQFGSNYYEYVSDPGLSWAPAEADAASMSYLGATGYLATVTSATENSFLLSLVPTTYSTFSGAWLGGEVFGGTSPDGQGQPDGGSAYWVVPSSALKLFSVGQTPVPGAFANWGGHEPNDAAVFSAVYMNVGVEGEFGIQNGQWADARFGLASGDPAITGDNIVGYFVEFSPASTPVPAALPLFATGLGALGLLGWRRKRKNAALAAA